MIHLHTCIASVTFFNHKTTYETFGAKILWKLMNEFLQRDVT